MLQRLYERILTVANGEALQVTVAQTDKCHAIGFPYSARIYRVVVKQNGGTPVPFTVDIFNRQICNPTGSSSAGSSPDPSEELSRVIPTQTVAVAGDPMVFRDAEGVPYRNAEGDPTNHVRKIYLRIVPQSPVDTTTWEVMIGAEPRTPV